MKRILLPLVPLGLVLGPLSGVPAAASQGFPAAAGSVAVHLAAPGQPAPLVRVHERAGSVAPAPTKLDGLVFLPFDANGRTRLRSLMPDAVRFLDDLPGASRLGLPGERGVLHHVRRALPGGGLAFGLLLVTPAGELRMLLELSGVGAGGADDPLLPRVSTSADGGILLAATVLAAGGDLYELDVAGGAAIQRTAGLPALAIDATSLTVADGFALATCDRGLLRLATGGVGPVQLVGLAGDDPDWFAGEVVLSDNRAWAATAAGASLDQLHLYVVGASGPARRATQVPAELPAAGFLPEFTHGPFLAVDDAGVRAAWRAKVPKPLAPGESTRELFLREIGAPLDVTAEQLTADGVFVDTLDEVGVITMVGIGAVLMAVGEVGTDPGEPLEIADFFRVDVGAGGQLDYTNLTMTSGDSTPEFSVPGTMVPESVFRVPQSTNLVVYDTGSGTADRLLAVDPAAAGITTLHANARELDFALRAGDWLAFGTESDLGQRPRQLVRVPADLSGVGVVLQSEDGYEHYSRAIPRSDGRVAMIVELPAGTQLVQRVELSSGLIDLHAGGAAQYGELLGLAPSGALVFSRELPGGPRFVVWPFEAPGSWELPLAPTAGHLVPGG